MKGISPALTTLLLIATAMVLILYLYPWLSTLTASLQYQWSESAAKAAAAYQLYITIIPPPADATTPVAIIHNSAPFTIPDVNIYIITRNGNMVIPDARTVDTSGTLAAWSDHQIQPGQLVLVYFPTDTNYYGYQIVVSSPQFFKNLYITVGT